MLPSNILKVNYAAKQISSSLQKKGWCTGGRLEIPLPDEPFLFIQRLSDSTNVQGIGTDFFEKNTAVYRSLSEFIERYTWKNIPLEENKVRVFTTPNIPRSVAYKEELTAHKHTSFGFIKVRSFFSLFGSLWCPAQLVSGHYAYTHTIKEPKEPIVKESTTNGLATSWKSKHEATLKGILELIERDAFMRMYREKKSPSQFSFEEIVESSENLRRIKERVERAQLEVRFLLLETPAPAAVIAACVFDKTRVGPYFTLGLSASFSLLEASENALREALAIRNATRQHKEWKSIPKIQPYMSSLERLYLWSHKQTFDTHGSFLVGGPNMSSLRITETSNLLSIRQKLKVLKKYFKTRKSDILIYRFPQLISKKIWTVLVLIPDLHPIELGHRGSKKENPLQNYFPHPFA